MRIAICDDERESLENIKGLIRVFCTEKNIDAEIDCFTCGRNLIASQNEYSLIFLDIYLTDMFGTDVVRSLNAAVSQFVFITASREHAVEAFSLNAVHYLVKPIAQQEMNEALERCFLRLGQRLPKILEVKTGQGLVPIPTDNIVYIEVFNKVSIIHTTKNKIQAYVSLNALYKLLDCNNFMRAQRSYIVNMCYIESFFFDHLILQGGLEIALSRSNRVELKNQYQHFLFHLARRGDI